MEINLSGKRKELNMTQRQIAIAVGVSIFTVQNWEYGTITPNDENLAKLKKVLKIEE